MILDDANGTKGIKIFNHSGCSSWAAEHWKSKESGVFFCRRNEEKKSFIGFLPSIKGLSAHADSLSMSWSRRHTLTRVQRWNGRFLTTAITRRRRWATDRRQRTTAGRSSATSRTWNCPSPPSRSSASSNWNVSRFPSTAFFFDSPEITGRQFYPPENGWWMPATQNTHDRV